MTRRRLLCRLRLWVNIGRIESYFAILCTEKFRHLGTTKGQRGRVAFALRPVVHLGNQRGEGRVGFFTFGSVASSSSDYSVRIFTSLSFLFLAMYALVLAQVCLIGLPPESVPCVGRCRYRSRDSLSYSPLSSTFDKITSQFVSN